MKPTRCLLPLIVLIAATAGTTPSAGLQLVQERQVITVTGDPGQAPPMPGMPGQRQFRTGTARVLGRAISTEGTPLRRAQIRISGPEIASKMALTDADGRYEFRDLPGGRFMVSATKSGFVTVQYGQTRPFESGKTIDLADRQTLPNIDLVMPRGGVIAGRVVDEFGEPVADVAVTSMRQMWAGGRRRMMTTGRIAQTNDLGQFRLYGLPPGEYFVSATLRGAEMLVLNMMSGSGDGPSGSGTTAGYAPTYFPGTPSPAEAQKISLAASQEVGGTDFALVPVRLSKVAGTVVGSDGKPLSGAMVNLVPASRAEAIMMIGGSARTNNEGAFTLSGVTPGDYMLQARTMTITTAESGGGTVMFSARMGEGADSEFGTVPVSVAGEDLTNVVLVTSKGGSATGKVVLDGIPRPSTFAMRVAASTPDMDGPPMMTGSSSAQVKADMTFELKGVAGPRLIRGLSVPAGLMVKAVRLNGNDVTDTPVEFKNGEQVSGIEIVIGKTTEVSGAVTDASGNTVKDYTIILFADDPQKWTLPMTRWVAGRRPDQEGRFKVENLPAGTYHAVAVDYIAQGEWGDPDLLERLKSKAKRVSLDDGEVKTIDLKLTEM